MTLYQPFLDHAIATLQAQLDLEPYPIPAGFEHQEGLMGKGKKQEPVLTTSHGFKSS
ncbi:MAG: phycoerythrobilin:ferredoxin oxidoreductase, partial [Waterburya sp.]